MIEMTSSIDLTCLPLIAVSTSPPSTRLLPPIVTCVSPPFTPAFLAGPLTVWIRTPRSVGRLRLFDMEELIEMPEMPRKACWTEPLLLSWSAIFLAVLIGTAKPIPMFPLPPAVSIWELMPTTRPRPSISGPPELPGLIAASVWITLSIVKLLGDWIWRWRAETIPAVTVRSRPNGLPIATTGSPTFTCEESPSGIGWSSFAGALTLSTAMSVDSSLPTTWAGIGDETSLRPSVTSTFEAPLTTWALVRMCPAWSITKPVPVAVPPLLPPKGLNGVGCCGGSVD